MNGQLIQVLLAAAVVPSLAAGAFSQTPRNPRDATNTTESTAPGTSVISGRVVLPSGDPVTGRVRITLSTSQDPGQTIYTDTNGGFTFNNLRPGNYQIEAAGDAKLYDATLEQIRLTRGARLDVLIHLRERPEAAAAKTTNVVSAAEADQMIPAAARTEFRLAHDLLSQKKQPEAIERFKSAIAIHPEYLMARNDLAVQYINLKMYSEALEQLEAAIEIAPKVFNPRLNLGIVLLAQKRYSDAIDHLRQAVSIDSSRPAGHLYLGIALVETDELEAASDELSRALSLGGDDFSVAHFYKALIHLKRGERDAAVSALQAYLAKSATGEHAASARALIERLNAKKQ